MGGHNEMQATAADARSRKKIADLDRYHPGWRSDKYSNGQPKFAADGTMLNERGTRSIFDDVDE